jgi:hypothetical protein
MIVMTVWSLILLVIEHFYFVGGFKWDLIGLISLILVLLSIVLVIEATKVTFRNKIRIHTQQ